MIILQDVFSRLSKSVDYSYSSRLDYLRFHTSVALNSVGYSTEIPTIVTANNGDLMLPFDLTTFTFFE